MATRKQESPEPDAADPLGLNPQQETFLGRLREDAELYALMVREMYHEASAKPSCGSASVPGISRPLGRPCLGARTSARCSCEPTSRWPRSAADWLFFTYPAF